MHNDPLWPVVPCQRVVCSDGRFGGPKGAAAGRRKQVEDEGVPIRNGRVVMTADVLFK